MPAGDPSCLGQNVESADRVPDLILGGDGRGVGRFHDLRPSCLEQGCKLTALPEILIARLRGRLQVRK